MATLVLSMAGQALGTALGSSTLAIVGRAAGALAGYAIDQALFGQPQGRIGRDRAYEGPRLSDLEVQASSEGAAIPRVYGRARLAGQIIWATRFEEVMVTTVEGGEPVAGSGGKGFGGGGGGARTATVTTYSYYYYANFAIGLCQGPIDRIGRIWADGNLLDLTNLTYRVYLGSEEQLPDSLIEAKEPDSPPAYRGLAYIVFERLPLEGFGNRLPQITVEIMRAVPGVESKLKAVTLIPGATEFGYEPGRVTRAPAAGVTLTENVHVGHAVSDWEASLDELQAVCPNLQEVALVVAWFGDDLRAGQCQLRPAVDNRVKVTVGANWGVSGLTRATAPLVSLHDDRPAFGGSPSDQSVVNAIRDLKARGLKVTFYPFVMMDVPPDNGLPDPWTGAADQPPYPWRGRITCDPAPGQAGTPDKTAAAATQLAPLIGTATPAHFTASGDAVIYSGPTEWSLRRMILHYAKLCAVAGGVDAFLIGSELPGLTKVRSNASTFPFVDALVALAADVHSVLGAGTELSYAADWSEYFGHQPADGSGDVYFHLDSLWSSPNIDFIGIDNYMPLADWRDGDDHLDAAHAESIYDRAYLRSNIAGGEGYDWYYASAADRAGQVRAPITDGAYGKPWIYRYKDLVSWWSNAHHDRPGGVEAATPTSWQPQSKPIRFTEFGCAAVDKGANQPNAFPDPKSAEATLPYFSNGGRDDGIQRAFLEAVLSYWDPDDSAFEPAGNPVSTVYGGRMLDIARSFAWAWDARPFPAFPHMLDVWADGDNWSTGHWLSGRLGGASLAGLVSAILDHAGFADYDVSALRGVVVDGYVIDRPMAARNALEPLAAVGLIEVVDTGTILKFRSRRRASAAAISGAGLVEDRGQPLVTVKRAQETELPAQVAIGFTGNLVDFRRAVVASRRLVGGSRRETRIELAAVMDGALAERTAEFWLHDSWAGRENYKFSLPLSAVALEPGDVVTLDHGGRSRLLQLTSIAEAGRLRLEARTVEPTVKLEPPTTARLVRDQPVLVYGKPHALVLDLPLLPGDAASTGARVAALADPWPGAIAVYRSPAADGFSLVQTVGRPATIGTLLTGLEPGPVAVWDRGNVFEVELSAGALSSRTPDQIFGGANAAAVVPVSTGFEILQFATAELIAENTYRLSGLVRAQAGTEDVMAQGHAVGATFVLINGAVELLALDADQIGLPLNYRIGPAGLDLGNDAFDGFTATIEGRGLLPLSPVHLSGRRDQASGDVTFDWICRTRIGGDSWTAVDVPLGEEAEAYRLEILDGGTVKRVVETTAPAASYTAAAQYVDFAAYPDSFEIRVTQLSATAGAGIPRTATVIL